MLPLPPRPGSASATALSVLVLVGLLLQASDSRAAGDPDLDWWTIETDHFRIHYERNLEPVAERLARVGEAIHSRLTGPMGYEPPLKTELVLTDATDSANGSATGLPYNTVRLFVTAPSDLSSLGDYDDWQLGLLTHEYTHILHVDNVSGIPSIVNAIMGKTLVPNQIQPRWILEGLAVLFETEFSSGGRLRSSNFDMQLRADVLEDHIAGLDQVSSSARRWPQRTLWYSYGAEFVAWISDVYGPNTMRAVSADYGASLIPWGVNRAIRRVTGKTYPELYEGFKDHIKRRYAAQMAKVRARGLREGKRLTRHGAHVYYPHFLPAHARRGTSRYELLYYRSDMHHRAGVHWLSLGVDADGERPAERLIARTAGNGPVSIGPDGTTFFSSVVPWRNVYSRTDLFALAPGEESSSGAGSSRQQLTEGLRATAPSVSPDGRRIAFTVNDAGTTTLQIADLTPERALRNRRILVAGASFDQAYTPVFSPDGTKVAYSAWTHGGYRDVRIVDAATGRIEQVTHDRALDTNPCWSPDGATLLFSSDRTGIANIYAYDLKSRGLRQITNVRTGALMPTVSPDGKVLAYVGYTSAGYDLYAMRLDPSRYLDALPPPADRPDPFAEPPHIPLKKYRYEAWQTFRPHTWSFSVAPGSFGSEALTITTATSDVVGHHLLSASVLADGAAPVPQFALDYTFARLPVDLSIHLSNRVTPRTGYRINDIQPEYIEEAYSLRTGLSYYHPEEFLSHRIGVSYTASIIDGSLPVESAGADPYASQTVEPLRGLIGVVHVGYTVSNVEYSFATPGAARGLSLTLGVDMANEATASTESIYSANYRASAYIPMPWNDKHTMAVRSAGAMSAGTYSRRGIYYVGGYDLENNDLLSSVTSGVFNGSFALRGYPPNSYSGSVYMLETLEYRFPVAEPDIGPSTLPLYLRRIDANLFMDFGGAFDELDTDEVEFFSKGALIHSPQLATSVGAEVWLGTTLAYLIDIQFRLGYAYGFSATAIPEGQWYFVASSAF